MQTEEQPEALRGLTEAVIAALSPLDVDCGPVDRADQGYRVHTGMIKFSWSFKSVKSKIKDLADPDDKARAQAARKYLVGCAETNMYGKIYQDHRRFLKDNIGDDDTEEGTKHLRQRPLRWVEMEGIECAVWPHLYWKTSMCETAVRASDIRRQPKKPKTCHLDPESESEDEETDNTGRQSLKASFLAKVLGPVTDYGANFELMQFVYDLHMWTTLGAKRNLHKEVPLRLKVKGMSFSPMFWHERHLALMDLQRQLGYPTLFFTLSPYEWSWPYHAWVVDHLAKELCPRLHLASAETLHLAHCLTSLITGWLTGATSAGSQRSKKWDQQILKDKDGKRIVINYCLRLEFQDGQRKLPKESYEAGGGSARSYGRGAVHVHVLLWHRDGELGNLAEVVQAHVPNDDPVMTGLVLGAQPSKTATGAPNSGWPLREEETAVEPDAENDLRPKLLLHHDAWSHTHSVRAFFPDVTAATKGSHQDVQQADGRGLLMKYVSTYVPKFSDSFASEWLDDSASDYHVSKKVLFDYHPQEPEMWLHLAAQQFPCFKTGASMMPIVAPYPGMPAKPQWLLNYESCEWKGENMTLLEYLRKANDKNEPLKYIKTAHKQHEKEMAEAGSMPMILEEFARDFQTTGQKVIAADMLWRLNDRFYGQWLALNEPFAVLEDLIDADLKEKVPARFYHLAVCLQRRPEYWRDLDRVQRDMELEAVYSATAKTVIDMLRAKTHVIDQYLSGTLKMDELSDDVAVTDAGEMADKTVEGKQLELDGQQLYLSGLVKKSIDRGVEAMTTKDAKRSEELHEEADSQGRIVACMGPPGCGKTTVAKQLVKYAHDQDGEVLVMFPTGQMQSRMRNELQKVGLGSVTVDTVHGACLLHKPEAEALPLLTGYSLIVIDEFPQLSKNNFERVVRMWHAAGKLPALLLLGDFHQLPSIEGTDARDSGYWQSVRKVQLKNSWRSSGDARFQGFLATLRKQIPPKDMLHDILRGHKAWNHSGPPTVADLKKLYAKLAKQGKTTTIITCTRKAAQQLNEVAVTTLLGRRKVWQSVPGDFEANPDNYTDKGELREDVDTLETEPVELRKGLRVHLTRNLDKENDFVNGMECTVLAWHMESQCLRVRTVTGKTLVIYKYTEKVEGYKNVTFFPIRLGYSSTVYKMQGAELQHVTIFLDKAGQRAAAYVAMSRVHSEKDYLFGGQLSKMHFVPNA